MHPWFISNPSVNSNWSYSLETLKSLFRSKSMIFVPCDLEIWQMTFKHLALFRSHWCSNWSHSPETPSLGQIRQFFSRVTLKFDGWPWKTIGTSPRQHQALCTISSSFVNSNWSYGPETLKLGFDPCDLDLWPLTLTVCMDLTLVTGNNSWKFHDTMMGT